ncbi:cysteine--tRNA ligase [Paracoccus sp. P2]|uniref:Cysteine--tRNA ligase n=1 Tax=Paracoccus pantotrophus TaxID=82367 RepID=A0A7H9BQH8_PARPN|nr:cysteine--tRNA ligase [Paracoccus pantotrophus]MDF3854744.1 cysteine--tRNA ligase [Paracoccus pantotrophus]QLH13610.1 cysteine--tRNA ligase [Paracoccus pantotrophus]RDD94526.1 cysteine--tRNA ligase [Paracoccus pantotrophus]RNI17106.1 cysteine--tRNA ligase [Paracoccus pantotrophus]WGR67226.1 cysteine--tRNA ligase [Paracoccus pantotrophus]
MVEIRLTNTRTRRKEVFRPIDPQNVRLYLCGPTVYDRAHLGNARPVVVIDVLVRLLRHVHGADHVTYVRNFTDVDDKINAAALARKEAGAPGTLEALIRERTRETIGWYHADMDALGAERPDHEPRATDYIAQMIAMIETLVAGGHAYARDGHVLFRVRSYADYGKLSGRSVDDMIAGARVEVAPFKEDPMDFVLWKPSDDELPGWDSPWGRGRPGWHIECSAMSYELLGESFDIHAGGIDLQFPHHENEIAQSCCAHPHGDFARVWLHNEMLQVEGRKMSKSLGNFFTVRDLLDQGIPGEVIRFVLLSTHYRKPMDWTAEKAREAEAVLRKWRGLVAGIEPAPSPALAVLAALADDLNTAGAIAALHEMAGQGDAPGLLAGARMLGLLTEELGGWIPAGPDLSPWAERMNALRAEAKASKDFSAVDGLKQRLLDAGVEVRMGPAGVELLPGPDFDAARLPE